MSCILTRVFALTLLIQDKSLMRQYRLWGSVRGVLGNRHPYRDQWTLKGAHLLLQTRTKVLNHDLEDVFRRWFPRFRSKAQMIGPEQKAA